ncbi:MAG: MoaD/ThiS family protein [Opitutaceae bacterium]|jgi:molybdopterin synthase sulfur carrier subunit|nr:MoaD/ThiS family protein [Opitutaceae bacterium]
MPKVRLSYFALLREQRGLSHEVKETSARSAAELYAELSAQYRFTLPADRIRVAIDGEFSSLDTPLREGCELVFIPPVAGG